MMADDEIQKEWKKTSSSASASTPQQQRPSSSKRHPSWGPASTRFQHLSGEKLEQVRSALGDGIQTSVVPRRPAGVEPAAQSFTVISQHRQFTMASWWNEFLCLHFLPFGGHCIDIRSYEVVGEVADFVDEFGEVKLPEEFAGERVVGVEDGLVVTDRLVPHSDEYPIYEFEEFSRTEFESLFGAQHHEWCKDETIELIEEVLANPD